MKAKRRLKLGRWGEKVAASHLQSLGYIILENNLRTPYGEIDLIARQADTIVFVEVKTRSSTSLGLPEISITPRKFAHILAAAQSYLSEHPEFDMDWRIDVIAIQCQSAGKPPDITHFESVTDV